MRTDRMTPLGLFSRRSRFSVILAGLALAVVLSAVPSARGAELLMDGGFEGASSGTSPDWSTTATGPFPTPFCIIAGTLACENGGGTAGPNTGDVWAWFGGTGKAQGQTITQKVTIPEGTATFGFYLWIGARSGSGDEAIEVFLDQTKLFGANQDQTGFYNGYRPVATSVDDFADGKEHTVRFVYSNPTTSPPAKGLGLDPTTSMHVDDVSLVDLPLIPTFPPPTLTEPLTPLNPPVIPELPPDKNGGKTGGGRDKRAPKVTVLRGPARVTHKRRARFRITAHEPGVSFQCRMDRGPYESCRSITVYRNLKPGKHLFRARGTDAAGNRGAAATHSWKIVRRR